METLGYEAHLFVPRKEAHRWVLKRVKEWKKLRRQSMVTPGDQIFGLVGERGAGKTWFLRHLAERDREVSRLAVYLDLDDRTRFSAPEEYIKTVEEEIRRRRGTSEETILLLDTVPPDLDEHLRMLEESILRPHVYRYRSLILMALVRPSRICWRVPALQGFETYALPLFDSRQISKQLRRLEKAGLSKGRLDASTIQQYSDGLPLLNHLLVTCQDEEEAFEKLLSYWFSRVPPDERLRVQHYLEAVCTLDTLENTPIKEVLGIYYRHRPTREEYPVYPWAVRNLLQNYWLARPSPESPGHITLVASVRRAIQEILRAQDPELYAELEKAAQGTPVESVIRKKEAGR